jgi:hypothetical protein
MRYCVQPATAEDVAQLAISMKCDDEDECDVEVGELDATESGDQLLHAFVSSSHVWAARDRADQPCALWGVGPLSRDREIGRFWLLTSEDIGAEAADMVALSIMILPEMLAHYRRLESIIDAQNKRAVKLVRLLGFKIEPAKLHKPTGRLCHRAWVEGEKASLPTTAPMAGALIN